VLRDVDVASSHDAWAVGYSPGSSVDTPVAERWDGTEWTVTSIPGGLNAQLASVSVLSTNDAWAVGTIDRGTEPLILHWDGTAWMRSSVPPVGEGRLLGVDASAPDDIWAVGEYFTNDQANGSFTVHFDGEAWTQVPSPNPGPGTDVVLTAVSMPASGADPIAIGESLVGGGSEVYPISLRWTGKAWKASQMLGRSTRTYVTSVAALSPTGAWAVGYALRSHGSIMTVAEHWDGSSWTLSKSRNPTGFQQELLGVSGVSDASVWAVGFVTGRTGTSTLAERWDGTSWKRVASHNHDGDPSFLFSVASLDAGEAWAVGYYSRGKDSLPHTLVEHHCSA
jgi:hypothetical protein